MSWTGGPKATRDPTIPEVTSGENNSTLILGSGCCCLSCGLAPLAAIGNCSRDSPGQGGCRDKDPTYRGFHLLPSCCISSSGLSCWKYNRALQAQGWKETEAAFLL